MRVYDTIHTPFHGQICSVTSSMHTFTCIVTISPDCFLLTTPVVRERLTGEQRLYVCVRVWDTCTQQLEVTDQRERQHVVRVLYFCTCARESDPVHANSEPCWHSHIRRHYAYLFTVFAELRKLRLHRVHLRTHNIPSNHHIPEPSTHHHITQHPNKSCSIASNHVKSIKS